MFGIINLDSGIELVDALFGTRRSELSCEFPSGDVVDEILRKRSRIHDPSDSAPDEFDGRRS